MFLYIYFQLLYFYSLIFVDQICSFELKIYFDLLVCPIYKHCMVSIELILLDIFSNPGSRLLPSKMTSLILWKNLDAFSTSLDPVLFSLGFLAVAATISFSSQRCWWVSSSIATSIYFIFSRSLHRHEGLHLQNQIHKILNFLIQFLLILLALSFNLLCQLRLISSGIFLQNPKLILQLW